MLWLNHIPEPRLRRYQKFFKPEAQTPENVQAIYLWNIALGRAIYPFIALFEITLRNCLDSTLKTVYGDTWLDPCWPQWVPYETRRGQSLNPESEKLIQTTSRLHAKLRRAPSRDELVADLTLGFWCKLLSHPYRQSVWYQHAKLKKYLFQGSLQGLEERDWVNRIYPALKKIQEVRNRIFHQEPVFDWNSLDKVYNDMEAILLAMVPDMIEPLRAYPPFEETWEKHQGWQQFKHCLFEPQAILPV